VGSGALLDDLAAPAAPLVAFRTGSSPTGRITWDCDSLRSHRGHSGVCGITWHHIKMQKSGQQSGRWPLTERKSVEHGTTGYTRRAQSPRLTIYLLQEHLAVSYPALGPECDRNADTRSVCCAQPSPPGKLRMSDHNSCRVFQPCSSFNLPERLLFLSASRLDTLLQHSAEEKRQGWSEATPPYTPAGGM